MADINIRPNKCLRCGGEWVPRLKAPRYCPLCKSPAWNKERKAKPMVHLSEVGTYPVNGINELLGGAAPDHDAFGEPNLAIHVSIPQNSAEGKLLRKTLLMKEPGPKHPRRCACQDCTFIRKYGEKSADISK